MLRCLLAKHHELSATLAPSQPHPNSTSSSNSLATPPGSLPPPPPPPPPSLSCLQVGSLCRALVASYQREQRALCRASAARANACLEGLALQGLAQAWRQQLPQLSDEYRAKVLQQARQARQAKQDAASGDGAGSGTGGPGDGPGEVDVEEAVGSRVAMVLPASLVEALVGEVDERGRELQELAGGWRVGETGWQQAHCWLAGLCASLLLLLA